MAIQIDLLPQWVGLRRKVKWAAIIMACIYVGAGTAFTLVWYQKTLEVKVAEQNVQTWQPVAAKATEVESQANAKVTSLTNKEGTVKFFADATQTGPRRAAVLEMMKVYVPQEAMVTTIDIPDGRNVTITASIRDTDEYGRLLLNLRKGWVGHVPPPPTPPVFASMPLGSGIGGFPTPLDPIDPIVPFGELRPEQFPLSVNIATALREELVLETPIAPGEAAAGAAGQPGQPGAPGGSGTPIQ